MFARVAASRLEPSVGRVGTAHPAASQMAAQDTLQKLWLRGEVGGMDPRLQLKVWAIREAWLDSKTGTRAL